MDVVWSARAKRDLATIWDYYVPLSLSAAVKILADIRRDVRRISENPELAPRELLLEGRREKFRSTVVRSMFKIVYFVEADRVTVAAIWDCRRAPARLVRAIS